MQPGQLTAPTRTSSRRSAGGNISPAVLIRRVFLAMGLLFGACYLFIVPPMQAPDEFAHWFRAYGVSEGHCIAPILTPIPISVIQLTRDFPIDMRLWRRVSPSYISRFLHQPLEPEKQDRVRNEAANKYNCLPYLPGAIGIGTGRLLQQSPEVILFLCRLANLIAYLAIVYVALGQLPAFHLPMLCLALMPMALSQAASASWDGTTFAIAFFLCAYVLKLAWDPGIVLLALRHYAILAATVVLAALCKSDGWLVLLLLLVPASKFGGSRSKATTVLGMIALSLAVIFGWNQLNHDNMALWVDRIKERHILLSENASFIVAHPLLFIESLMNMAYDWSLPEQFIGKLGWLAVLLPRWAIVLYSALLAMAALADDVGERMSAGRRFIAIGIVIIAAVSVFVGIWCAETTQEDMGRILHGSRYIVAVQGRYFIPFAFPLLLAIAGRRSRLSSRWLTAVAAVTILTVNAVAVEAVRTTYYRVGDTTKDYDRTAAQMDLRELGAALPGSSPDISGSWNSGGYYQGGGGPGPLPVAGAAFGTYPDANTGTVRMGPFQLDGQTEIAIPLVTGPDTRGLSIAVREAVSKEPLAQLAPPPNRQQWWAWHPLLPAGHPIAVEVVAEDNGRGWGEWMAVGWPHFRRPWGTEVPLAKLGSTLPGAKPEISGAWIPNGYYTGPGGPGSPPAEGAVYGSYPDANTGSLRIGPFDLDEHTRMAIPLVTGPDTHGLSVIVRDAGSKEILALLAPPPVHPAWWAWQPALPAGGKLKVEVLAEDKGSGWGQWLALGWPHAMRQ